MISTHPNQSDDQDVKSQEDLTLWVQKRTCASEFCAENFSMKVCFDGFRQISLRVRFAGSFIVGEITSNGSQRAKERLKSTFPISMAEMVCVDLSLRREPRGRMNRRQQR